MMMMRTLRMKMNGRISDIFFLDFLFVSSLDTLDYDTKIVLIFLKRNL